MMIMGQNSLKKQRLPISRHVCLVSHSRDEEDGDEYQLYFLDLNLCNGGATTCNTLDDDPIIDDDVYTHVLPTFRFHGRNKPRALCLLGSTLFIFEGYLGRYRSEDYDNRGKSALRFHLFPNEDEDWDQVVERHRVCDMHTSKHSPRAIPTPDAKRILVFSTGLINEGGEEEADSDFELYDPWTDTWLQLPQIPCHYHYRIQQFCRVEAYSFIDEHLFFIQLCDRLMFVLDLESLEKGWGQYEYGSHLPWIEDYFPTINNKFVFTPERIYDVGQVGWSREALEDGSEVPSVLVPQSSFPPTDLEPLRAGFPSITILYQNGVVHWCALKSESVPYIEYSTRSYTRLLIDVYVTHLNAKLNTKIIRTLQLLIDHHSLYNVEFVPNI